MPPIGIMPPPGPIVGLTGGGNDPPVGKVGGVGLGPVEGITGGVDYTVATGLVLTGELSYQDTGAGDSIFGLVQLSRTW